MTKATARVVRDLDLLDGFAADGATNDTAKFTALEAQVTGVSVDLKRKVYRVDQIPSGNRYRNGFFALRRTPPAGSAVDILHPAQETLLADTMKLTTGNRYCSWPEYKWHVYNGVIYAAWNEGFAHNANDLHVRMARSYDGGDTFTRFERLFQSASGQQTCWAGECLNGQQLVIVREIFSGVTNHKLYGRRLGEKRTVTCDIKTTSGSNVIELMLPTHGTRPGQTVEFDDTFSVGGVTVTGNVAYAAQANAIDTSLKLAIVGSANASATATESRTFDIQFLETGFSQIQFGGVTFGEAVIAKGVLLSQPAEYTGIETVSGQGIIYVGVGAGGASTAPGTVGEIIVKASGLFSTPIIAKTVPNGGVNRGDTMPRRLSDGRLMGLCRTNNAATPKMWFSDDDLSTFTVHFNGPGTTFVQSSVPFVIVDDTWVIASATGNRFGDQESSTASKQGPVPVYLLVGRYSELKSLGWTAFTYYLIGYVFHENRFADNEAPGCGVGSITLLGDTIILGNATENYDDLLRPWNNLNGSPDIYVTRLRLGDFIPGYQATQQILVGQNALAVSRGAAMHTEAAYIEQVEGSSSIYGQILVNATTGAAYSKRNLTVSKTGTGVFSVQYVKSLPGNRIYPKVQCINQNGRANVGSVSSSGFNVYTVNASNVATDYDFIAEVSYLSDAYREEWMP